MEFPVTRPLENHQHHLPWPDHRQLQPPTVSSLSAWPSPTCSFSQARRKNQAFVCTFLISVHSLGNTLSPSPVLLLLHPRRHTQHCLRSPQGLASCLRGRSPCWGGSGWSQLGCPHQKPLPGHQPACPAQSCASRGSGVTLPVPGSLGRACLGQLIPGLKRWGEILFAKGPRCSPWLALVWARLDF